MRCLFFVSHANGVVVGVVFMLGTNNHAETFGLYGLYGLYGCGFITVYMVSFLYMVCMVLSFPNTYVPTNINKVTEVCNFKCFRRRSICWAPGLHGRLTITFEYAFTPTSPSDTQLQFAW
jgi:hypothetical protein